MIHPITIRSIPLFFKIHISDMDLPSFPPAAIRTLGILQDPSMTNGCFARMIQQDDELHLTQRILRLANSSYSAPRTPIRNVADAISRLGRREFFNLVVIAAVGKFYDGKDTYIRDLWNHAIATGIACLTLAKIYQCPLVNEAFLAGILHDVGKLIVYNRYPFIYKRFKSETVSGLCRMDQIEANEFPNLSHSIIGLRVIRKWNLSSAIADAAYLHHRLEYSIPDDKQDYMLPCIVSLASVIVNNLGINTRIRSWPETASMTCARFLKFNIEHVNPIRHRLEELFDIHNDNVNIDKGPMLNNQEVIEAV
jgi:HD-like signal output (HDOD) protein